MNLSAILNRLGATFASALGLFSSPSQTSVPKSHEVFGTPLSKEADEFLTTCNTSFNEKQKRLGETWINNFDRYDVDLQNGVLWFSKEGRKTVEFDVAVVGSIQPSGRTWEWAWNNPNVESALAVPQSVFEATSQRFGLKYLSFGTVPVPRKQFGWYLSGIALQLAGGEGVYMAEGKSVEIYMLLRNPRRGET
jgi:hypothetical protein